MPAKDEKRSTSVNLGAAHPVGIYVTKLMAYQLDALIGKYGPSMSDVIAAAVPVLYQTIGGDAEDVAAQFDELYQTSDLSRQKVIEHALTALWAQERKNNHDG